MPRYFFDIQDHERFSEDDTGVECATLDAMRDTAMAALPDLVKTALPEGDHHTITVSVRDEDGKDILMATLKVDVDWLIQT